MTSFMTMMVMKTHRPTPPLRVSVAEAKSQLSSLLRAVDRQPVIIHNRGHDVARLVPAGGSDSSEASSSSFPFVRFFNRLEALRRRMKMKGVAFQPERAVIRPVDPFGSEE
jgi:prevent-host-death family protein